MAKKKNNQNEDLDNLDLETEESEPVEVQENKEVSVPVNQPSALLVFPVNGVNFARTFDPSKFHKMPICGVMAKFSHVDSKSQPALHYLHAVEVSDLENFRAKLSQQKFVEVSINP